MRYDRMILAALLLFLIVFLLISLIRCAAKGGKPDVQAANAPVVTTVVTTLSPEQLQQRHAVYPYAITVVGDSIASGFSLYGAIPEETDWQRGALPSATFTISPLQTAAARKRISWKCSGKNSRRTSTYPWA